MTRIGAIVAMPGEARTLMNSEGVVLENAGIGLANARQAACRAIDNGADALLVWGTAGGLVTDLRCGALVLPRCVRDEQGQQFYCESRWVAAVRARLSGMVVVTGDVLSVAAAVRDPAQRRHLAAQHACAIVDMESAAVAAVAAARGKPHIVVRSVLDPVGTTLPSAALRALSTSASAVQISWELLRRPDEIPAVVRLGRQYHTALRKLRRVARRLQPDFAWTS